MQEKAITAEELAKEQRVISVAEFFEKNRHLLGFDNPAKALLTGVKEACDNSIDACEDANLLPEVFIELKTIGQDRYRLVVEDNGPGIVKRQIGPIFGKLLYGSKFQTIGGRQSRGQQGIGISAVVLYSQLTTGKPTKVISKTSPKAPANLFVLHIDTKQNEPEILRTDVTDWAKDHGTRVEIELVGRYIEKRASVFEYIKETAVANPHSHIVYIDPNGQRVEFPRVSEQLPEKPKRIRPHPYGIEFGILQRMIKATKSRTIKSFLTAEFDKVGTGTAAEILKTAEIEGKIMPRLLTAEQIEALIRAMQSTKVMAPSTNCLSPIGAQTLKKSLESEYDIEFSHAITRPASVYRGNPFIIECCIGYGGTLEPKTKLIRFANKVPLLYQQGACAITKAVNDVSWRTYGLQQVPGTLPQEPMIILVHIASVWAPFTSESKEAVAHYPEIIKEIKLALQECGRALQQHLSAKRRSEAEQRKKELFKNYAGELAGAIAGLTGQDVQVIHQKILQIASKMYPKEVEEPEKKPEEVSNE